MLVHLSHSANYPGIWNRECNEEVTPGDKVTRDIGETTCGSCLLTRLSTALEEVTYITETMAKLRNR